MANDALAPALIQSMAHNLTVVDLIRTAQTLTQSGQVETVIALYSAWVSNNADNPLLYAVLFNYSVILTDAGKLNEAKDCLERAIQLNPDFMPAHINLGRIHERMGAVSLGVAQWSVVLGKLGAVNGSSVTHKTTALNQIARTMEAAGQDDTAEEMLRQSLEIDPRQREVAQHFVALRQRQCKWPVLEPWERVEREVLMHGISPLSIAAYTDDPLLQLAVSGAYNKADVGFPKAPHFSWPAAEAHTGPLKIGYLSSDLREHAVGHLMAEIFGLHDRSKVEIFAYYCGPETGDPMHQAFKASADHWRTIGGMTDAEAAQQMIADGIQILVDVNGYTREARYKLVALRPAPVIVNWLGFPGTMASPYHHYIVADEWIIPERNEIYYSEKVLRLPCYQPTNRKRVVAPGTPSRKDFGLPDDAMVYCCFNGAHKITRFTFERWMTILKDVPGSVLWLLAGSDAADGRLKAQAERCGVDPKRLIFAQKLANPLHLARYQLADLFLDTTPYGAHTTASDALWMGVPVLTASGRSFASRVCGSLVRSAGLPELVCEDLTEYVERAIAFGRDPALLTPLRRRLNEGRDTCVLFDTPLLVGKLEALYAEMWGQYKAGMLPKPDLANLDDYLETGITVDHEEIEAQILADYAGWWRDRLAARSRIRPIGPDRRIPLE